MTIDAGDPGCLSALTSELGHGPPFGEDELAAIGSLTILHARDLAAIEGCVGLRSLRIIASELTDLLALERMTELAHLEVHCTRLDALLGAAFCPRLERVDLLYTTVQDAGDLLGIEAWRRGVVVGNPWTDTSWGALQHELERPEMLVDLSAEYDWKQTCRLWERAGACCGAVAGYGLVVRPGLPALTGNLFDALNVPTSLADNELDGDSFALDQMFQSYASRIVAPDVSELAQMRTLGSSADAQRWIAESTLGADDKAALDRFVRRFPLTIFHRASEAAIDRTASAFGVTLPASYRALRATLDGWMPRLRAAPVRFDRFEGPSPRADRVSSLTYHLGLRGHGDDTRDALLAAGLIIVGLSVELPRSTLALRLTDSQIYEYSEDDILDAMSENRDVATSIRPVFPSYAAMLGHVVSIHPPGGEPIEAT
jgi:hypothetical protein